MTLFVTAILVFFLVIYPLLAQSRKLGGEIVTTNSLFSSQVVDAVKGFKLIKASTLENYVLKKITKINEKNAKAAKKILDYAANIKFII